METNVIQRIDLIKRHYQLKEKPFAERIGKTQQSINAMFKRKNPDVMLTTIVDILRAFPEINVEWLVMGYGEMFKKQEDELSVEELRRQNAMLIETNLNLSRALAKMGAAQKKR